MRGKRSNVPVVVVGDERWGSSILPGVPTRSTAPASPDATPAAQPPYVAPAPQYSPPPPFSTAPAQFSTTPDPRFGVAPDPRFAAAAPQFGAPPQFGPPQGYAPSPYAQPAGPQYFAPPPPGGMPSFVKIVLGVVGGLFALGVLAAIAIPVFLSQKQRPANRAVSVPATVLGQTQMHTPELDNAATQAIAEMQRTNAPWGQVSGSYFGTGELPTFFVAAAKVNVRPTAADESALFASLAASTGAALSPVGAGPFGGRMECGPISVRGGTAMTQCYSIDSAAIVAIIVFDPSPSQAALLARQIIGSVEH